MSICGEYFAGFIGLLPKRLRRINPDALENRWVNFVYTFNLSEEKGDESIQAGGAWSAWDIPVNVSFQTDDERGDDLIFVAIANRLYSLDWDRHQDEWNWEVYAPIYRRVTFGPLPSPTTGRTAPQGSSQSILKRFREFGFNMAEEPADGFSTLSVYRITVAEYLREATARSGVRQLTSLRGRTKVAVKGLGFQVTIEHEANEPFTIDSWTAEWDVLGRRIQDNPVTE